MIQNASILRSGDRLRVRVFATGPFQHTLRVSAGGEGYFDFADGSLTAAPVSHAYTSPESPIEFAVDLAAAVPTPQDYLLVLTPLVSGVPQDGEEDGRLDLRVAVQVRR